MISGFYRPDTGNIVFAARTSPALVRRRVAALGIARTFQNIALFAGMTMLDNIMLGRTLQMRATAFRRVLLGLRAEGGDRPPRAGGENDRLLEIEAIRKPPWASSPMVLRKRVELAAR